jgi:hypothetical protein
MRVRDLSPKAEGQGLTICQLPSEKSLSLLHYCVDTSCTLPQYLVLRKLPVQQLGGTLHSGPEVGKPLQGKIVHGGTFMATKKKAKKKKH